MDVVDYPQQLVAVTNEHNGVRYTEIGEEGDWLVMLGHVTDEQAAAVIRHEGYYSHMGLSDSELISDLNRTWGRFLTACPDHRTHQDGCVYCHSELSPERWGLDWWRDNKDRDGFPVTVWEVNA